MQALKGKLKIGSDLVAFLNQAFGFRDNYVFEHSLRVAELAVLIGRRMGLANDDLEEIRLAGVLHDLGKAEIPDEILNKPGSLNEEEWAIMRDHPLAGRNMVHHFFNGETLRTKITTGIMFHHEKWDGTGYPNGLKGREIPIFARILCVADVYDGMISERSYHHPHPVADVIAFIRQGAGSQFDPEVVQALLAVTAERREGTA